MNSAELQTGSQVSTKNLLVYLQNLLEAPQPRPLAQVMAGLATAFASSGAGVIFPPAGSLPERGSLFEASWSSAPPENMPWETDPALIGRVKTTAETLEFCDRDDNAWLFCMFQLGPRAGVVWLANLGPRAWSVHEKSGLELAARCLTQRVIAAPWPREGERETTWQEFAHLQHGIDRASVLTRRLAHDFCNILTSILGFAELSVYQLKADSPAHHYAMEVLEAARLGAAWSQKLQLFSLQQQARFVPTALAGVLAEESAANHWRQNVSFKVDLPASLPSLAIDKEALRMVLDALLTNAREALSAPNAGLGVVTVSARAVELPAGACLEFLGNPQAGAFVEVTITDSGPGFSQDARGKLFRETFFTTKGRRRGMGLAAVYGILRVNRAGFRIASSPERGTTIQLFIPAAPALAEAGAAQQG